MTALPLLLPVLVLSRQKLLLCRMGSEGGKLRDRTHDGLAHAKQHEKYVPEFYSKRNTNKVFQLNLSTLVQLLELLHGGGVSYGQIEVAQVLVKPGKGLWRQLHGPVLDPGAKGAFF